MEYKLLSAGLWVVVKGQISKWTVECDVVFLIFLKRVRIVDDVYEL